MAIETLIRNATIVDGTGADRYLGDIGLEGGKIVAIGRISEVETVTEIDATGLVVAPGFIDMHSHSDVSMFDDPGGDSKVFQGVTTEVTGNCSYSPFPSGGIGPRGLQETIGVVLRTDKQWEWTDFDGWANSVESNGVSYNVAQIVGHAALRFAVGASGDRPPSPDELTGMQKLAAEAIEQGAVGFSTGLTLGPSMYADTDEIVSLCEAIAPYGNAFYATHARVWAGNHVKALEEAAEIGRRAGVPVEYSHIAIGDSRYYGRGEEMTDVIDRARTSGLDMTCDVYPYTAGASGLFQSLPMWVQDGGTGPMLARLRDPVERKRAFDDMAKGHFGGLEWHWDKMFIMNIGSDQNQDFVGRSLQEISEIRGEDPREVVLALVDEEDNDVGVVGHNRIESDVEFFVNYENSMIGSDGFAISSDGIWSDDKPHPRFYGCYPLILGRYVREKNVLSLERAIYKMTGLPAERLGLSDRGVLTEGNIADVVVFDPKTIIDHATYESPHQLSDGVRHLYVNGECVIRDGVHTRAYPGRVLRRGN